MFQTFHVEVENRAANGGLCCVRVCSSVCPYGLMSHLFNIRVVPTDQRASHPPVVVASLEGDFWSSPPPILGNMINFSNGSSHWSPRSGLRGLPWGLAWCGCVLRLW